MRFHFVAVPVHGGAEARRELNTFLGSHRVLGIEQHLVADGAQSARAICISYTDATSHHAASPHTTNLGFTNEQLAERARRPLQTRSGLAEIEGVRAVKRSPGLSLSGSRTLWP